jgi:hypothetical protein
MKAHTVFQARVEVSLYDSPLEFLNLLFTFSRLQQESSSSAAPFN